MQLIAKSFTLRSAIMPGIWERDDTNMLRQAIKPNDLRKSIAGL